MIELIIGILILGFALLSLLRMYGDLAMNVSPEYRTMQVMIAKELIEEIRSQRFDELFEKSVTGNWSTTFGVDASEDNADTSTYDDVDDYHGFSQSLGGPYEGFSRDVTVDYVVADDLNTALAIPNVVPNVWTPAIKRVTVTVSKAGYEDVVLQTLVTDASKGVSP